MLVLLVSLSVTRLSKINSEICLSPNNFTSLNLKLDTKILNDTGVGTANASDSGGTQVNFVPNPDGSTKFVDVQGIKAFLPGSLAEVIPTKDLEHLVGNYEEFKVIKLDK